MKKFYMMILMLLGLFYWTVVLDYVGDRGRAVALSMILLCLLVEVLLIKALRRDSFEKPYGFNGLMDVLNGLEWLIFFCFSIKAFSMSGSFFEAKITIQTLLFIVIMSLFLVPSTLRDKKKKKPLNFKRLGLLLVTFFILDRGLVFLQSHMMIPAIYTEKSIRFAHSNLNLLMYVTWIVNVEFLKKQFLHFED